MSDELDEPFEQMLQHGMALSGQIGRELSRAWQTNSEKKARDRDRSVAMLQRAYDSERESAAATLKAVQSPEWWDEASVRDICEAYELANAWADHDPRAAHAEETMREAAAERYGIDPDRLNNERHRHTEHIMETSPEHLAEAQRWARKTGWTNDIPSYYPEAQKVNNLLKDYDQSIGAPRYGDAREPAAQHAERDQNPSESPAKNAGQSQKADSLADSLSAQARRAKGEGDSLAAVSVEWGVEVQKERHEVQDLQEQAHEPAPTPTPGQEPVASVDAAEAAQNRANAVSEDARGKEYVGERVAVAAQGAYGDSDKLQAQASQMRAAGAPEAGIRAKQFGQTQQKFGPAHAASGAGKATGKVKAGDPKKKQEQARKLSK